MLRNNADARRCSYFELGLPVMTPHDTIQHTEGVFISATTLINKLDPTPLTRLTNCVNRPFHGL